MNGFKKISWLIEAYGPITCGALTLLVLWHLRDSLLPLMAEDRISIGNLFSAIFGWASIQTGCVYAIYGFIAGKTDGFIGEVRNTRSMKRYSMYIKRAIFSGFILTVFSMPLIVWKFRVDVDDYKLFVGIALWFSVFVWAFLSFARVAYIFGILIRIEDVRTIRGGCRVSIEKIHLRKLLQLFYADPKLERKLLLEDIRADIAKAKKKKEKKEGKKPKEGGDFYGAFWSDVKDHAAGISDITEETDKRIADNEMRGRLYPILRDSFLFMWNDMMRWRNERFEFVPKSVHAQLPTNELGAVVKIENTVAVKIWDESHRIIYPYFSEHPTLSEDAARLGFWALREALPDYQAADFRIVDIQHRKYFRPDEVGTTGDEKEQFTQKYAVLLRKWRDLKAGR